MDIHSIKGQVYPSASLIATIIERSKHYDYDVVKLTPHICAIQFTKNGKVIGEVIEEGPLSGHLQKFPKNIRFKMAIIKGFDLFCKELHQQMPNYEPTKP